MKIIYACMIIATVTSDSNARDKEYSPNVGTVLFSATDTDKKQWSKTEVGLLQARKYFQNLLPPPIFINTFNEEHVKILLGYFKDAYAAIKKEAKDAETDTIMTTALSDAIGGYFKAWVLPVAKLDYYGGTISQANVVKLFQFYNEIKRYLDTDGEEWHKPEEKILNTMTINVAPLQLSLNTRSMKDPCDHLAYFEKTPTGLGIPIPNVNWNDKLSTMFVPLKNVSLLSMNSPNSSHHLIKYYDAAKSCIETSNLKEQANFDEKFQKWLIEDVVPHLKDENLYLALGSVLSLVNRTRDICNNVLDLYVTKCTTNSNCDKCKSTNKLLRIPYISNKKMWILIIILVVEIAWCVPALLFVLCSKKLKQKDCNSNVYLFIDKEKKDKGGGNKISNDVNCPVCTGNAPGDLKILRRSLFRIGGKCPSSHQTNTMEAGTVPCMNQCASKTSNCVCVTEPDCPELSYMPKRSSTMKLSGKSLEDCNSGQIIQLSSHETFASKQSTKSCVTIKSKHCVEKDMLAKNKKKRDSDENRTYEDCKRTYDGCRKHNERRQSDECRKLEQHRQAEQCRKLEDRILAEECRKLEERRQAEECRKLEEHRQAEECRKAEVCRKLEELRKAEECRKFEERRQAEECRKLKEQRKLEECWKLEEQRQAEEFRKLEEQKQAEECKKLEEQRQAEECRKLEEQRQTEECGKLEEQRQAEEFRKLDEHKQAEECKKLKEQRQVEECWNIEEQRQTEECRKLEERRQIEVCRKYDNCRNDERRKSGDSGKSANSRKSADNKKSGDSRKSGDSKKYEKPDHCMRYEELEKCPQLRQLDECREFHDRKKAEFYKNHEEKRKLNEGTESEELQLLNQCREVDELREVQKPRETNEHSDIVVCHEISESKEFEEFPKFNESVVGSSVNCVTVDSYSVTQLKYDNTENVADCDDNINYDEAMSCRQVFSQETCQGICPCTACVARKSSMACNVTCCNISLTDAKRVLDQQLEAKSRRFQVTKELKGKEGSKFSFGKPYLEITIDRPGAEICVDMSQCRHYSQNRPSRIPKPATCSLQPYVSGRQSTSSSPEKHKSLIPQLKKKTTDDIDLGSCQYSISLEGKLNGSF